MLSSRPISRNTENAPRALTSKTPGRSRHGKNENIIRQTPGTNLKNVELKTPYRRDDLRNCFCFYIVVLGLMNRQ